ncbi:hypothetical protein ABZ499_26605 [Streptomyces sp. NPDC019990]|uniref:hypothetical protein n=1 Tax=Streptomyces sp. NPDC019990 TaxID=3154693 RepID=UPI0033C3357C
MRLADTGGARETDQQIAEFLRALTGAERGGGQRAGEGNALIELEALGVPGDVPALVALLGDRDGKVWGRARQLVYRFKQDPVMRAEVLHVVREGEGGARAGALEIMPAGCWERLLDSLLVGLRDVSPKVRIAVAERLVDADPERADDALAAAPETSGILTWWHGC